MSNETKTSNSTNMLSRIEKLATDVALREGCRLYDVEFAGGGGGRILRVYIDKDLEGGAGLEDCANVSRGLNLLLDVEDPIPGGRYTLEVSTPGVERPLRKAWHFEAAVGKKIWLKLNCNLNSLGYTSTKMAGHKQLTETIESVNEAGVHFKLEEGALVVPLDAIEKAKVVFEFGREKGAKIVPAHKLKGKKN
jgi:ribosome maturation factor RimP